LAKIAVGPEEREAGTLQAMPLAAGAGWSVRDVVCSAGPQHRPFEEQHTRTSIAIVVAGTFQYRTSTGRELMTPGSLLLGTAGQAFTCSHEHGQGDRCVSFSYSEDFCERLAEDTGTNRPRFRAPRIAPARALAPLVARGSEVLGGADRAALEELAIEVYARAVTIDRGAARRAAHADASSLARITRVVRMIDEESSAPRDLNTLAKIARLSPYHFLRTFEALTGTTPHQYLLGVRLRRAAVRLRKEKGNITEIALGCGFGDISNFNRAFRREFGVSPRDYRRAPGPAVGT
jgi:AraC family transcriptional regulator